MRKRRQVELFSISFLDLLSGALGAVIILYVAIPKQKKVELPIRDEVKELLQMESQVKDKMIQQLQDQLKAAQEKIPSQQSPTADIDFDIGFKFRGKNIVFIIDTSYSMVDEDRMGQVKAGLKMLITTLSDDYKIEIVRYPLGERAPFKSMWGTLRELDKSNKQEAFEFVYSMRPYGGTPTREVLTFVLRNYDTATDIVLLTDGVPTLHNSNKHDDIYDILREVREENGGKRVRISAIGVGSEFIKDKTNDRYKFLSMLTQENDGFFVGF